MSSRDYSDKAYKAFRQAVRNRDCHCKWPGCKKRTKLQVHHILPWAHYPLLRYTVANGITLCKAHHNLTKGKEMSYAKMFIGIVNE